MYEIIGYKLLYIDLFIDYLLIDLLIYLFICWTSKNPCLI